MSQIWAYVQRIPFKRQYELRNQEILIGKRQDCDIIVTHSSKVHARILFSEGKAYITSDYDGHVVHGTVLGKGSLSQLAIRDYFGIIQKNGTQRNFIFQLQKPLIKKRKQISQQQTQKSSDEPQVILDQSCMSMNNKLIIRAAKMGNTQLLIDILSKERNISNFLSTWGPENPITAVEIAFIRQDHDFLEILTEHMRSYKLGTAIYSRALFHDQDQVRDKKKLLNEAFTDDINEVTWNDELLQRLASIPTEPALYDLLPIDNSQLETSLVWAIRSGNIKTASYLANLVLEFNENIKVHHKILNEMNPKKIKNYIDQKISQSILPIHCACIHPNAVFLEQILNISQVQSTDEINRSPIHYAAASQTPATLELLIKFKVNLKVKDIKQNTPLMIAAQYGRLHNIDILPKDTINEQNDEGHAAIHLAAIEGHLNAVKKLADAGAQMNLLNAKGMSAISLASAHGHLEVVKFLQSNENYNRRDNYGRTSLIMAARNGNFRVMHYLIKSKANIKICDYAANSALHYAVAYGFPECVGLLIKAGANINSYNHYHLTPIQLAIQKGLYGIVKEFINHPLTNLKCTDHQGRNIVMSLMENFNIVSFRLIKQLILEKQFDIYTIDHKGRSLYHYISDIKIDQLPDSSYSQQKQTQIQLRQIVLELIEILLNQGLNINSIDKDGLCPYMYSLQQSNYKLACMFHKYKPDMLLVNKFDKNLLHILIESDILYTFKGLNLINRILGQNLAINYNLIDNSGFTPLLRLIQRYTKNRTKVLELLLNKRLFKIIKKTILEQEKLTNIQEEVTVHKSHIKEAFNEQPDIESECIQINFTYKNQTFTIGIPLCQYAAEQERANRQLAEYQQMILQIYHQLIELGANPDACVSESADEEDIISDSMKVSTHFICQYYPNLEFLKSLKFCNLTSKDSHGRTPMHLFAEYSEKTPESIEFFNALVKETELNTIDNLGRTVTYILAVRCIPNLLQIAFDHGGNINTLANNVIPLHHWVKLSHEANVKFLVKHADVNYKDNDGRTALHFAVSNSDLEPFTIQKILLENGADETIIDNFGRSPLFYAFTKIGREPLYLDPYYEVSKYLDLAQIKITDCLGRNLLHYAAYRGSFLCAQHFISLGCSLTLQDIYGNTPLAIGFLGGHQEMCKLLIQYGFDTYGQAGVLKDEKVIKYSVFRLALRHKLFDIALQFIDRKYDLKKANEDAKEEKMPKLAQLFTNLRQTESNYINAYQNLVQNML